VELALRRRSARRIEAALEGQAVRVPAHFDAEVFAAIRRLVRRRVVGADRAALALLRNARLVAERVPLLPLYAEAFTVRDRFGPADVFYAVLARSLSATLVTSDAALARAARGYAEVRYLPG
jgi:predicted nucleic acid-binding protein